VPKRVLGLIYAPWGRARPLSQVRYYYYRLIKRLNKILGEGRKLDLKNNVQVHEAMVKYWEVVSHSQVWAASPREFPGGGLGS
jgi:hypothetical protein